MIIGVGLDILYLPRLIALVKRRGVNGLARRILTQDEVDAFEATADVDGAQGAMVRYLAVRWVSGQAGGRDENRKGEADLLHLDSACPHVQSSDGLLKKPHTRRCMRIARRRGKMSRLSSGSKQALGLCCSGPTQVQLMQP